MSTKKDKQSILNFVIFQKESGDKEIITTSHQGKIIPGEKQNHGKSFPSPRTVKNRHKKSFFKRTQCPLSFSCLEWESVKIW